MARATRLDQVFMTHIDKEYFFESLKEVAIEEEVICQITGQDLPTMQALKLLDERKIPYHIINVQGAFDERPIQIFIDGKYLGSYAELKESLNE